MAQFTVYQNDNEESQTSYPYLLNIQSDLLESLNTRVVIPMSAVSALGGKPINNLTPKFDIEGQSFILLTPQIAGIQLTELGSAVTDLSENRFEIISAIDFLISGF